MSLSVKSTSLSKNYQLKQFSIMYTLEGQHFTIFSEQFFYWHLSTTSYILCAVFPRTPLRFWVKSHQWEALSQGLEGRRETDPSLLLGCVAKCATAMRLSCSLQIFSFMLPVEGTIPRSFLRFLPFPDSLKISGTCQHCCQLSFTFSSALFANIQLPEFNTSYLSLHSNFCFPDWALSLHKVPFNDHHVESCFTSLTHS